MLAVDPTSKTVATVGTTQGILSDLAFSPDGTLYVANSIHHRIDSVTPGGVFTQLIGGLSAPEGLAADSDGSRLFVAHFPKGAGRIDHVSLPGAVLTAGKAMAFDVGYYTSGLAVDVLDNVITKSTSNSNAIVTGFKSP